MKGYIRKRGNSYRVEIHIGYTADGKRIRHSETVGNKKAAEKYLRQKLDELETEGGIRARSVETFEGYLLRWLDVCARQRVRQRTWESYSENVARYVTGTQLGRQALATITPADIQELYSQIGRAHAVRHLHAVIRQALQQAVRWREVSVNAALSVDLPKTRKPEHRILAAADFPRFVASAQQEPRNGAMWVLALATGMRPEEYLGLLWSDFNETMRRVTIQRALVRPRKIKAGEPSWRFEPPKTERSRRTLVLEPETVFLLKQHRARQAEEKLLAGPAYTDHNLVFAAELGQPLRQTDLCTRTLKRILKRAGLPENLTMYSLRHAAATALLKDRESLKVISEMGIAAYPLRPTPTCTSPTTCLRRPPAN